MPVAGGALQNVCRPSWCHEAVLLFKPPGQAHVSLSILGDSSCGWFCQHHDAGKVPSGEILCEYNAKMHSLNVWCKQDNSGVGLDILDFVLYSDQVERCLLYFKGKKYKLFCYEYLDQLYRTACFFGFFSLLVFGNEKHCREGQKYPNQELSEIRKSMKLTSSGCFQDRHDFVFYLWICLCSRSHIQYLYYLFISIIIVILNSLKSMWK